VGAAFLFRVVENELVRQTEQELIAQSASLAASWRHLLTDSGMESTSSSNQTLTPIFPSLDLRTPVSPPRPEALPAASPVAPAMALTARIMDRIMAQTQQFTLAGMRLLDGQGTVLAGREEVGQSLAHVPEIRAAMDGRYASLIRKRISDQPRPPIYSVSRGTDIRVFTAFPVLDGSRVLGVIYLSRTPTNILQWLYDLRHKLALAGATLLSLTVMLGILVSSAIARPIRELLRQVERVRTGEARIVEPIKRPVSRELAQLSESFSSMSQALAERGDYIGRFASHVSHEFKTPLTAMQGALELLRDHDMSPEDSRKFLDNLLADTERMKQLVNRLLDLARADALEPTRATSSLKEIVQAVHSRFRDRGMAVEAFVEEEDAALPIAPEALEIVLANLVENSLRHGANRVETKLEGNATRLVVTDNGEGISPANQTRIFTPFFTTRRASGGTGLGLEICRSILKAYGGSINIAREQPGKGAQFVLEFPVRK
jgi:signal transduction histidine kinase